MWGSAAAPELMTATATTVNEAGAAVPAAVAASGGSAVELIVRQVDVNEVSAILKLAQPGNKLQKAFKKIGLGKCRILHATAAVSDTSAIGEGSYGREAGEIVNGRIMQGQSASFTMTKLSRSITTGNDQDSSSTRAARPLRGLWSGGYWIPANDRVNAQAAALASSTAAVAIDFKGFVEWINSALACQCSPSNHQWLCYGAPHSSASQDSSGNSYPIDFVPMDAVLGIDVRVALRLAAQVFSFGID